MNTPYTVHNSRHMYFKKKIKRSPHNVFLCLLRIHTRRIIDLTDSIITITGTRSTVHRHLRHDMSTNLYFFLGGGGWSRLISRYIATNDSIFAPKQITYRYKALLTDQGYHIVF
jgi:hypothetical protein